MSTIMFCPVQIQDGQTLKRRPTKENISIEICFCGLIIEASTYLQLYLKTCSRILFHMKIKNDNIIQVGGYFTLVGHL